MAEAVARRLEALAALDAEELITARQGGGTFIAEVAGSVFSEPLVRLFSRHAKATRDYLEFRADLESAAAARAHMAYVSPALAEVELAKDRQETAGRRRPLPRKRSA